MVKHNPKAKNTIEFDVVIIGAGPAGLSFAAALAPSGLRIALIEQQPHAAVADQAYDGREIALTHHSHAIMQQLGIWQRIAPSNISLIKDAKVLNGTSPYALHFNHRESGKDNLGFMISNHLIRRAAYEAAAQFKNIHWQMESAVEDLHIGAHHAELRLSNGQTIKSKLVVAADSRFSRTRDMAGIQTEKLNFDRTCIVCRMSCEKPHDYTAYECFFESHTLAVLPLNNQHVSVVMTIDSAEAGGILSLSPVAFAEMIEDKINRRLGKMKLPGKLFSYPLIATYAQKFYAPRYALLGDAAVGMHPVTAHGFNFGLRGADVLAHEIQNAMRLGLDIGASPILRRYSMAHRIATRAMYLGTNILVKLYTNRSAPAAWLRGALLKIGNNLPPAKKMIMNQLTESRAG